MLLTQVGEGTRLAFRRARRADFPSEEDYSVAKIRAAAGGKKLAENFLDFLGRFLALGIDTESTANSNAVRVANNGVAAKNVTDEEVSYLSSNTGEREKSFHRARELAAVFFN